MSGPNQYEETLDITRSLLAAMDLAGVKRLIAISSISVLDYMNQAPSSVIDEATPLCQDDLALGNYARMKRDQELLCKDWKTGDKQLVILRPGLVYSETNLSEAHAGFIKKGLGLSAKHQGQVPLVHVDGCC